MKKNNVVTALACPRMLRMCHCHVVLLAYWTAVTYFKEPFFFLASPSLSRPVIQILALSAFGESMVIMQTHVSRQQADSSWSVFRPALLSRQA
jgi:hypothetical protein